MKILLGLLGLTSSICALAQADSFTHKIPTHAVGLYFQTLPESSNNVVSGLQYTHQSKPRRSWSIGLAYGSYSTSSSKEIRFDSTKTDSLFTRQYRHNYDQFQLGFKQNYLAPIIKNFWFNAFWALDAYYTPYRMEQEEQAYKKGAPLVPSDHRTEEQGKGWKAGLKGLVGFGAYFQSHHFRIGIDAGIPMRWGWVHHTNYAKTGLQREYDMFDFDAYPLHFTMMPHIAYCF